MKLRRIFPLAITLSLVLSTLACGGGRPEPTKVPIGTDAIVFRSERDGNSEIYIMNADGSGQTRLTNDPADDRFPSWSPDGTKIAFRSRPWLHSEDSSINVMNSDGSGQTRLTKPDSFMSSTNTALNHSPHWSPVGTEIRFSSDRGKGADIYIMNSDGSGQTRLTFNANIVTHYRSTDWSPDGTKIAFSSFQDGNFDIYVMNSDGSGQTRLTYGIAPNWDLSWSPGR